MVRRMRLGEHSAQKPRTGSSNANGGARAVGPCDSHQEKDQSRGATRFELKFRWWSRSPGTQAASNGWCRIALFAKNIARGSPIGFELVTDVIRCHLAVDDEP